MPVSSAPIAHGVVVVQGREIVFVGEAVPEWALDTHEVALGNSVLMPGLVNAHSHLELTEMRGMLEALDFRSWLGALTAARRELFDNESLLDAARQGIAEGLRNGITTYADTTDSGVPLDAMRDAGVRGIGYIEVFGPDPAQCDDAVRRLAERAAEARTRDSALVKTGISPHAPYTVSAPLFERTARLALSEGYPIAVHVAESTAESAFVRDGTGPFADGLRARGIRVAPTGQSPIALLHAAGVLDAKPLLIHAIHADDDDIRLIARAGATVVHCPISNAKLGHGIGRLSELLDTGIAVGLGTDSVASNDRMDMLGEARQAALFASLRSEVPDSLPAARALEIATLGGARALGLADRIGTLEPGKDADLAAFPLDDPDAGPVHDPAVTLVHVLAGRVQASLVTVAGKVLVERGVVVQEHPGLADRSAEMRDRLREWFRARRAP